MSDKEGKRAAAKAKLKEKLQKAGNSLTNSKFFQKKVDAAWEVCDTDGSGSVNKEGMYAGILFIHLKLAENAGPSACHPPTREVCDKLFDAADVDKSGSVDKEEFSNIIVILCGQLLKRMLVYYAVMIAFVPIASVCLVKFSSRFSRIPSGTFIEKIAEHVTTGVLFSQVVPMLWDKIDSTAEKKMIDKANKDKGE